MEKGESGKGTERVKASCREKRRKFIKSEIKTIQLNKKRVKQLTIQTTQLK